MLKITQKLEANVKATVKKTGKTYTHSRLYAKIETVEVGYGPAQKSYFIREGRGWKEVIEPVFKQETSEEAVRKIEEQLGRELKQRVEEEMRR